MIRQSQDISPAIIDNLQGFYQGHGRAPSMAELAKLAGYASKNAAFRLVNRLMKAGWVDKDQTGRIRLTALLQTRWGVSGRRVGSPPDFSEPKLRFGERIDRIRLAGNLRPVLSRPLLGYVQAGFPSPAEEELGDAVTLDDFLIRKPQASFLLKVNGDSMINAGIQPGDTVVIERGTAPKHGDIVLAMVDRDWTLKYFERRKGKIVLVPANPHYPEIIAREELKIEGIVRSVMRRY